MPDVGGGGGAESGVVRETESPNNLKSYEICQMLLHK